MNVLVIGSGGREHAISWKLSQSPSADKIFCAPGNAGIAKIAQCVDIPASDCEKLAKFAKDNSVGLTVVGPELPLCNGITDVFRAAGLKIFGPSKAAAQLEGSKIFSKKFMKKYAIPTAAAEFFQDKKSALKYLADVFNPNAGIVVKADGLAAGKGVIVCETFDEAEKAIIACFEGEFGAAGNQILIEETLRGEEASILALTDGKTIIPLASSQDHKRVGDDDCGPNTGGMGAYSPAPAVSGKIMEKIKSDVLARFLAGIKKENMDYRGVIYAGIMLCDDGPKVLEFNVRFGDPETQAILPRMKSDFLSLMLKTADASLANTVIDWDSRACVSVVMVSGGYPGQYQKGFPISGLDEAEKTGAIIFHSGTSTDGKNTVNSGGRVLSVTAMGESIKKAASSAYDGVSKIKWDGVFFRKDIAAKAIKLEKKYEL